jgi:hypothetical protein
MTVEQLLCGVNDGTKKSNTLYHKSAQLMGNSKIHHSVTGGSPPVNLRSIKSVISGKCSGYAL